jgi:hypothetical protein
MVIGNTGIQGHKDCGGAGTPVRLAASSAPCLGVALTADVDNVGRIAYGFSNAVRSAAGGEVGTSLAPGQSVFIPINDVTKVWLDGAVTDGVGYTATQATSAGT